jgi:hypothetical protein
MSVKLGLELFYEGGLCLFELLCHGILVRSVLPGQGTLVRSALLGQGILVRSVLLGQGTLVLLLVRSVLLLHSLLVLLLFFDEIFHCLVLRSAQLRQCGSSSTFGTRRDPFPPFSVSSVTIGSGTIGSGTIGSGTIGRRVVSVISVLDWEMAVRMHVREAPGTQYKSLLPQEACA